MADEGIDRTNESKAGDNTRGRDRYRDNDDVRDPLEGDARTGGNASTESEARGDARENVGNNARGTAANPTGPEGNDKTRRRPRPDSFDSNLD